MNKLLVAALALTFSACAANPSVHGSTPQSYRPKGEDAPLQVESRLIHKTNLLDDDYAVLFRIDNSTVLGFQLDKSGNGSLSCDKTVDGENGLYFCHPHNGHKIGASCNGSTTNRILTGANCSFTYDNEIAANFRF